MTQRDSRTCNSFEALRLFCLLVFVGQCFCKIRWTVIRIPGTFPSQDISCSLSDCVRPFSESIFLNALFWIFFCLHALCDVTEGLCLCVFRLTGHYPPPHPAWSWAHPLSPSHCCLVYASFQTRAKSDNSIKPQQTTSHSGRLCIVAKGQTHNTEDMIDDKCCVFLPPGSLFI